MLSWQKACRKYVDILSNIPIAPTHKCRFQMMLCVSKCERTMFLVLVVSVRQIGLMHGKIILMLGAFLVLPKIERLLLTCCSFCVLFDHLIQRDPAQLTFFKLCGQIDPYNLLLTNPSQSLRGYWDCLEVIRLVTCGIQRVQWLTIKPSFSVLYSLVVQESPVSPVFPIP